VDAKGFTRTELDSAHAASGEMWHEFLRVPDLSVGLYVIPAGDADPQSPHQEDEVYYVVSGRGKLTAGQQEFDAAAGSILFVAKQIPHKFHAVTEELRVLVFFAPAHTG
jgi:mannose-6-phosphate isomerase-like protein (cupin superfamily)